MSENSRPRLKVSREGIVLIKSFEGFRPRAVQGEDGGWTIGYGHTASAREGLAVGEHDAELLLQYDLLPVVKALNDQVAAPLNQHQFDALASFALSVGLERFLKSDVLDRINAGHAGQAADALIGWPEAATREAALRRRAAERALFVADPASPVLLTDLMAAPLPPPPVVAPQPEVASAAEARAAAVASLLGEPETPGPERAEPEPQPAGEIATVETPTAPIRSHLQRYSPYAASVIGPLPGFPAASPLEPTVVEPTPVEPEPNLHLSPPAADEPTAPEPVWTPIQTAPVAGMAPPIVPVFSPAAPSIDATPFAPTVQSPGFPPLQEPLVLTPATEADFGQAERPVWPAEERLDVPADEQPLFEAEPALSVLRHEIEPTEPRRFDWSETGMYLVMGGLGLASCAFSAAAFRLSVVQPSPMGETTVVAWALALIGVICVGVSSWNLYVRWGRSS